MSEIKRYTYTPDGIESNPRGEFVLHATYLAARAELVRLLRNYRVTDEKISGCCISYGIDLRCETCKEWDALEGA